MSVDYRFKKTDWALILGASSGFGGTTAVELAKHGMNICGVHFDRAATIPNAEKVKSDCESHGVKAIFFNVNATDAEKRKEIVDTLAKEFTSPESNVRVLMHSLAFGSLKPFIAKDPKNQLTQAQIEMTMDVMANALVYWTQAVFNKGLMKKGARIFTMTSSGGHSQFPDYGAVSAAKAASESYIRQLALELGPYGITANAVMAGVTDTAALRKIPGNERMINIALSKNPALRLTTPDAVAKAISLLAHEDAYFISGNTIGVDGGEDVVEFVGENPTP
ncbi:MAG: SDR family oxidoreductase [Ignavibacteriales bacterium]|nr:SDR family oxidoreductase [Ignavibacteriales bacterium]